MLPAALAPLPPRQSAVDACESMLRNAILVEQFPPGARLPPERTLATALGVNRVTVRSALVRLASARLLSVRQGSGYVVRDYLREGGLDLVPALVALATDAESLPIVAVDLLRARRGLARAVLESLAERDTAPDLAPITRAVHAFEAGVEAGLPTARLAELDLDVAHEIVVSTQSPVLALALNPIAGVLTRLPALRDAMFADPRASVIGYELLLAWLPTRVPHAIDAIAAALRATDDATIRRLTDAVSKKASKKKRSPR